MNFSYVGWCKEKNHDKVWGVIELAPCNYTTFWGRRGKKLQTKSFSGPSYEIDKLIRQKSNKGYVGINKENLDVVYPEFEQDLEKTAVWAMLTR